MSRLIEYCNKDEEDYYLTAQLADNANLLNSMSDEEVRVHNINSGTRPPEFEIEGVRLKDLYLFFADLSKSKRQKLFDEAGIDTDLYFFKGAHSSFSNRTLTEKQYASLGRAAEAYKDSRAREKKRVK